MDITTLGTIALLAFLVLAIVVFGEKMMYIHVTLVEWVVIVALFCLLMVVIFTPQPKQNYECYKGYTYVVDSNGVRHPHTIGRTYERCQ